MTLALDVEFTEIKVDCISIYQSITATFSRFPIQKPMEPILTLSLNRSKSTQSHRLYKPSGTGVSDAFYS